jgi:hypothetical protein
MKGMMSMVRLQGYSLQRGVLDSKVLGGYFGFAQY